MTAPASRPIAVGETAPDFTLRDQFGQQVRLAELVEAQHVLVVFYPFAFSGICTGELGEIRDDLGAFVGDDLQVVTISCDPMFALRAWADQEGYFFPLLSDFWPHGRTARDYGVFHEGQGMAVRGTFLVERGGTVRWSLVHGPGERRDFSGYRRAVAELRGAGA